MINEPPVDKLVEKIGSRYALCVVVAKRARQLIDQSQGQGDDACDYDYKAITAAAEEIMEGKLVAVGD